MGGDVQLDRVLTQAEFAELVGITQPAVSDLVKRGVLRSNLTGATWLREYCTHLREEAAGRAGTLADASAALKNAQRVEVEMRTAIKRKEYVPVGLIAQVLAHIGRQAAVAFDGIKPGIRMRWPDISAEQLDYIDAEVSRARNLVASMSLASLPVEDDEAT